MSLPCNPWFINILLLASVLQLENFLTIIDALKVHFALKIMYLCNSNICHDIAELCRVGSD